MSTENPKTGIHTVVYDYAERFPEARDDAHERINRELAVLLGQALADGRQYAVRYLPLIEEHNRERQVITARRAVTVALVDARDARVGELTIQAPEHFSSEWQQFELWGVGQTDIILWRRILPMPAQKPVQGVAQ